MASSPKRKQSLKKSKRNFHLGLVFVYTLSILVAMFFLLEQKENIPLYSKYIKTFGKVAKTDGDVISNIRSDVKKIEHINEIKVISILGERNTGTTWMYEHLNKCFNHTIPIKRRLTRYKHWFQDEKIGSPIINQTLVLSMFRNPFEWTEAMRSKVIISIDIVLLCLKIAVIYTLFFIFTSIKLLNVDIATSCADAHVY